MFQDRLKWNEKYQSTKYSKEPAAIVKKYAKLAHGKRALDIAAGNGRNALFLANQGFVVDAIDIAEAGLSLFAGKHRQIHTICADLDTFDIRPNYYDLIVDIKFLNRRLFPYIKAGLTPGGVLIFQSFLDISAPDRNPPDHADYYLRQNELLHAFLSLNVVWYQEAKEKSDDNANWLASLVAAKPC
jgi:SAM-dependent methyltransferase